MLLTQSHVGFHKRISSSDLYNTKFSVMMSPAILLCSSVSEILAVFFTMAIVKDMLWL